MPIDVPTVVGAVSHHVTRRDQNRFRDLLLMTLEHAAPKLVGRQPSVRFVPVCRSNSGSEGRRCVRDIEWGWLGLWLQMASSHRDRLGRGRGGPVYASTRLAAVGLRVELLKGG